MAKNPQLEMMRAAMKAAGMNDKDIEQALAAQEAAMKQAEEMNTMSDMQKFASDIYNTAKEEFDQAAKKIMERDDMDMDSYFEFSKDPSIDKSDQWAVACGADLIHLRADVINDLSAGLDKEDCASMLSSQWGIDNKEEFIEMAESLLAGRHSNIYKKIAEGEEIEDFEDESESFEEAMEVFEEDDLINEGEVPDMAAWDLGRLINISRFAFDAGFLSREEALGYIRKAALEMKKHYKSWKELSTGYQFGRYIWGGGDNYEEMKEGMEQLLTEEDSPWVTLPFDMKLDFKS